MEVYEIYTDASFLSRVPLKYSGAYIVYLNSKKIYENSYVRHIKNEGKAEIYNLNKSIVDIANRYISRDKKQIFIFKTDCKGNVSICNNILNNVITNTIDYKTLNKEEMMISSSIKRFKNSNLIFKWIPRDENKEADLLAKTTFENHLKNMGLDNKIKYMQDDLTYTLNKWRYWGIGKKYIDRLNKLILELDEV